MKKFFSKMKVFVFKTLLPCSILFIVVLGCGEKRELKYPNGQLKEQYHVKLDENGNYVKDGQYNSWYENGQKFSEGTFKDGKEEGPYTSWYENGQKKYEGTFKDGNPEGINTEWYENGQKKCEWTFKDGKQDGISTTWYENGQKATDNTFKDGKLEGITVNDADGNVYHTVKIGNQVWTVENLRTTKFNDGTAIPLVTDKGEWRYRCHSGEPGYCWFANDINNLSKYGALYNWYAVDTKKLAPAGWHVPTDSEWDTLQNYLIANGYNWDGTTTGNKVAKSLAAKEGWFTDTFPGAIGNDLTKNNKSGFSALPGGYRSLNGYFNSIGSDGYWWSASEFGASYAFNRTLASGYDSLSRYNFLSESCGFSARLLRD